MTLDATLASFNNVSAQGFSKVSHVSFYAEDLASDSKFQQAVSELVKGKPTYVVIGDATALPYADEIGL